MNDQWAWIGLGSNLNHPNQQLDRCLTELDQHHALALHAQSKRYASKPLGPSDQPDFVNMAIKVYTKLAGEALLDLLQDVERLHHRERIRHWGERTLDLDLLLYGDQGKCIIATPRLSVPHPQITQRDFVLQPLIDLEGAEFMLEGHALGHHLAHCSERFITQTF